MTQGSAEILLPPKLIPVFEPARGEVRYRGAYGGRGSGKSFSFALMAAVWGAIEPIRVLCTREFQVSIKESFHMELRNAIESYPWLAARYDIGNEYIRADNGTTFLFRGIRNNIQSIKSLAHIDLTIVEEAEDIPEQSWQALLPTVFRTGKAELWALWNPKFQDSPVDMRFRQNCPDDARFAEVNWSDNPFFPAHLNRLRQDDQRNLDDATYRWIWEGQYLTNSKAQVFAGKYDIDDFEPGEKDWHGPYHGGDFGFSQDPTAAVRCWIHDDCLWIDYEAGQTGLELDDTAKFITDRIPTFYNHESRWDNARPESISYLKRHGMPRVRAVTKGKNSVEDGVEYIKSFRRVKIHPRCKETINEFRLYSYKVDKYTEEVKPDLVDKHNHYVDALRYALEPAMKNRGARWAGAV